MPSNNPMDSARFKIFVGDIVRLDDLLGSILRKLDSGLLWVVWLTDPPDYVYQQNELRLHERC